MSPLIDEPDSELEASLFRLLRESAEPETRAAALVDLGGLGFAPRRYLGDPWLVVRGCAALAPALADDPGAHAVLAEIVAVPRAFDAGFVTRRPRQWSGPPRFAVIEAACERLPPATGAPFREFAAFDAGIHAIPGDADFRGDVLPYLRRFFADGWPELAQRTRQQRGLATHVAACEGHWDGGGQDCRATLQAMALPTDREAWRALAELRKSAPFTVDDLVVLDAAESVRQRPKMYFGAEGDELGAAIIEWLVRSYESDGVEASVEILADDAFVLTVPGRDMSLKSISRELLGGVLGRLAPTAAMCSRVSVTLVSDGKRRTRRFAHRVALGPIEHEGPTTAPDGYRVEFVLDRRAVPAGIVRAELS